MEVFTSQLRGAAWDSPLPAELDSDQTLVTAFVGARVEGALERLAEVQRALPRAKLLACSTGGEIHGRAIHDDTISVAIARFERTEVAIAAEPTGADAREAGRRLGLTLARPDLAGVLMLCSGVALDVGRLACGLRQTLRTAPISGGLAGDGDRFQEPWVHWDGAARRDVAVAVGLYGDRVRIGHGSRAGWDPFGPERRITRAEGNVLYELDGQPALELYRRYLGELASGLPSTGLRFPLAIRADREGTERLVRTILGHSEADRSLTFAGEMPEGAYAQLMMANGDRLVHAAGLASEQAVASGPPSLCIAVSCVGRRWVLGERAEEEVEAVAEGLPPGCALAGFYSYGELSPVGITSCNLHNQTMTITTLAEAA